MHVVLTTVYYSLENSTGQSVFCILFFLNKRSMLKKVSSVPYMYSILQESALLHVVPTTVYPGKIQGTTCILYIVCEIGNLYKKESSVPCIYSILQESALLHVVLTTVYYSLGKFTFSVENHGLSISFHFWSGRLPLKH